MIDATGDARGGAVSIHEEEAIIRAAVDAHPGLLWWIVRGERGMSSASLLCVLTGVRMDGARRDDLPLDPGDFGRCVGLLDSAPTLRALVPDLAAKGGRGWPVLARIWPTLEALHEAREGGAIRRLLEQASRGEL